MIEKVKYDSEAKGFRVRNRLYKNKDTAERVALNRAVLRASVNRVGMTEGEREDAFNSFFNIQKLGV